jgi:hypothetical protein
VVYQNSYAMFGINVPKETTKKLVAAGQKFAQEVNIPIWEIEIRIMYAKDGNPYYELFRNSPGIGKKIVRRVHIEEIV